MAQIDTDDFFTLLRERQENLISSILNKGADLEAAQLYYVIGAAKELQILERRIKNNYGMSGTSLPLNE